MAKIFYKKLFKIKLIKNSSTQILEVCFIKKIGICCNFLFQKNEIFIIAKKLNFFYKKDGIF